MELDFGSLICDFWGLEKVERLRNGSFADKYFSKGDHCSCWLFCQFIIQVLSFQV